MKDKIVIIIVTAIITSIVLMTMSLVISILEKEDYEKLGLDIKYYNIDYCTVYCEDIFSTYKVYKLTRSYINEELDEYNKVQTVKVYDKKDDSKVIEIIGNDQSIDIRRLTISDI